MHNTLKNYGAAIEDFTKVITLADALPDQVALAYLQRTYSHRQLNNHNAEIDDYTHVVELLGVSPCLVASALVGRGVAFDKLKNYEAAKSDFTRVIELPDARQEDVAFALHRRGLIHVKRKNFEAANDDFTRAIELQGISAKLLVLTFANRARVYAKLKNYEAEITDYTHVITLIGLGGAINTYAYVKGNPLSYTDPYGLWPLPFGIGISALGVPNQVQTTSLLNQALQAQGIPASQAQAIAQDVTNQAGMSDISAAQAMGNALQKGQQLTPAQQQTVQQFINRLPFADQTPLNKILNKYCSAK